MDKLKVISPHNTASLPPASPPSASPPSLFAGWRSHVNALGSSILFHMALIALLSLGIYYKTEHDGAALSQPQAREAMVMIELIQAPQSSLAMPDGFFTPHSAPHEIDTDTARDTDIKKNSNIEKNTATKNETPSQPPQSEKQDTAPSLETEMLAHEVLKKASSQHHAKPSQHAAPAQTRQKTNPHHKKNTALIIKPVIDTAPPAPKAPSAQQNASAAAPHSYGTSKQSVYTGQKGRIEAAYHEKIRAAINAKRIYPTSARRKKLEGIATIEIVIDANGNILQKHFVQGTGHHLLDKAVWDMIAHANPLPKPPLSLLSHAPLRVRIPIGFKLR